MQTTTKKRAEQERQGSSRSHQVFDDTWAPRRQWLRPSTYIRDSNTTTQYRTALEEDAPSCKRQRGALLSPFSMTLVPANRVWGPRGVQRHAQRRGENRRRDPKSKRFPRFDATCQAGQEYYDTVSAVIYQKICSQAESSTTRCGRGCIGRQSVSALSRKGQAVPSSRNW